MISNKTTLISFIVILFVGIFLGGYFVLQSKNISASNSPIVAGNSNSISQEKLFISPSLNYSVTIPGDWFTNSFSGQNNNLNTPTNSYDTISNESISAPLEMSNNGVSMTVEIIKKENKTLKEIATAQAKDFVVTEQRDLLIDGLSAIQEYQQYKPGVQDNYSYSLVTYIESGENVYVLNALSLSLHGRENNIVITKNIVNSFKVI